jgi:hypothetical protein
MTDSLQTSPAGPPAQPGGRSQAHRAVLRLVDQARLGWRRLPSDWTYIGGIFLAAKIVLSLTGLLVLKAEQPFLRGLTGNAEITGTEAARQAISAPAWVSMWFAWDSFI